MEKHHVPDALDRALTDLYRTDVPDGYRAAWRAAVAREEASRMKQTHAMLGYKADTEDLLSIVGNLDLLVGVRLHALIFAAVMDVPFLGVSYDPKIDRFLETLAETPVGTLESLTAESLFVRIEQSLADQSARQRRRQRVDELRRQALFNAERAIGLIGKKE